MRTFTFEYNDDLAPLGGDVNLGFKDFKVNIRARTGLIDELFSESSFILRVRNPCDETSGVPASSQPGFCTQEPTDIREPEMPQWMRLTRDITIFAGQDRTIGFGQPVNSKQEPLIVSI